MRIKKLISFTDKQYKLLEDMMAEDYNESASQFVHKLIVKEHKERLDIKNKKSVGRPKKEDQEGYINDDIDTFDFSDDLPKNIPYYGKMIGKKEEEHLAEIQKMFRPK